jgi:hypothetical protein
MALIHFTAADARQSLLPSIGPGHAGQTVIRIDENVSDCEGIACGERLESMFSNEDLALWLETHAERPPVSRHSHLVVRGSDPETRASIFAVFR